MPTFTTTDGTDIFFKDWGAGQPVVFSHGWPLDADAWDGQLKHMADNGFRAIAHDRRGHGRSGQPWQGNDMDTYADDLAQLIEMLDLRDAIVVGHSTGGGEVTRYLGRHGTRRGAKAGLLGGGPPSPGPAGPGGGGQGGRAGGDPAADAAHRRQPRGPAGRRLRRDPRRRGRQPVAVLPGPRPAVLRRQPRRRRAARGHRRRL